MKTMCPDVALTYRSLSSLRTQFEAASIQHPKQIIHLIHAGEDYVDRIDTRLKKPVGPSFAWGVDGINGGSAARILVYPPDDSAHRVLSSLAACGGNLILAARPSLIASVPRQVLKDSDPESRWWLMVFELAWKEIPGSPLRARRFLRLGPSRFSYNRGLLRRSGGFVQHDSASTALLSKWATELPEYFECELDDACRDSVVALDFLLTEAERLPGAHHEDRLWVAVEELFERFRDNPVAVLRAPLDDPTGLNAAEINHLCSDAGLQQEPVIRRHEYGPASERRRVGIVFHIPGDRRNFFVPLDGAEADLEGSGAKNPILPVLQRLQEARASQLEADPNGHKARQATTKQQNRRGRRPEYDPLKDQGLLDDLRASGLRLKDFAREKGIKHTELIKVSARVRSRKARGLDPARTNAGVKAL